MGGPDAEAGDPPGAVLLNAAEFHLRSRAVSLVFPHEQLICRKPRHVEPPGVCHSPVRRQLDSPV
jgi:hypothetical protein